MGMDKGDDKPGERLSITPVVLYGPCVGVHPGRVDSGSGGSAAADDASYTYPLIWQRFCLAWSGLQTTVDYQYQQDQRPRSTYRQVFRPSVKSVLISDESFVISQPS